MRGLARWAEASTWAEPQAQTWAEPAPQQPAWAGKGKGKGKSAPAAALPRTPAKGKGGAKGTPAGQLDMGELYKAAQSNPAVGQLLGMLTSGGILK